ncbi:MAG: RDD family protein [Actinobacteria bacterium]|nr:RDD family protein [Actinomycetota bacterium]
MDLDDFITLATPEGIELEMSLAGAGSRAIAGGTDLVLRLVLIGALAAAVAAAGELGTAVFTAGSFAVFFGYDVLFEVLGHGQTPGKRLSGLRVVQSDGRPVDLRSSAVRNLARLIDGLPLFYVPTVVSILATRNNQRPGDLAADTIVIRSPRRARRRGGAGRRRDRRARAPGAASRRDREPSGAEPASRAARAAPSAGNDWDVSGISAEELAVVRRFLERREGLTPEARRALAGRLAEGLRPRVSGAGAGGSAEGFLETLATAKAARGGRLARPGQQD